MRILTSAGFFFLFVNQALPQTSGSLLQNGSFSIPAGASNSYWTLSAGASGLGSSTVISGTGGATLRLLPTSKNSTSAFLGPIFGYAQGVPASAITSSRLYVS